MYVYNDTQFGSELGEVIDSLVEDGLEKENIVGYKLDIAERRPVLGKNFDIKSLMGMIDDVYGDEHYDEAWDVSEKLSRVFKKHIDFEALSKDLEEVYLYYPEGEEYAITEQDYEDSRI